MPRNWSKAIPEGNGPVPQREKFGSDQPTLADVYRIIEELSDKSDRKLDELTENLKRANQRVASLEQDARQPHHAIEVDVPEYKKTRESKEGAAAAVQAMHEDSFAANWVDPDPKRSIRFGDDFTGLPAVFCSRDDALVGNGAAAPKSCLSPLEMRTPTAADGLLSTGKTSTATRNTFDQPPL